MLEKVAYLEEKVKQLEYDLQKMKYNLALYKKRTDDTLADLLNVINGKGKMDSIDDYQDNYTS